jgi:hypothetical protein
VIYKVEIAGETFLVIIEKQEKDEDEDEAVCEQCGKVNELRPCGKRLESGRRLRICFDCAMLNERMSQPRFTRSRNRSND